MKFEEIDESTKKFSEAMFDVVSRYIPPKIYSKHLEDIVFLLIDALFKGKLYISFDDHTNPSTTLKADGWPKEHYKALIASRWLDSELAPMKLEANQLSWRRWYFEMNETIQDLVERSKVHVIEDKDLEIERQPKTDRGLNKEQQSAVNAITKHNIILLSGGPGTGKTSTIIEMLVNALTVCRTQNIGLSAPTGKAARRLQETLQLSSKYQESAYSKELSQITCRTLHSWLEAKPSGFGKDRNSPIDLDLLVVDEMSMVDLNLMQALLEALPKRTKLILVGDPNQLPPIGSGSVWETLQKIDIRRQFGAGAIHLQKIYRNRGDIASLSSVIRDNGIEKFWEKLGKNSQSSNVKTYLAPLNNLPPKLLTCLEAHKTRLTKLVHVFKNELPNDIQLSSTTDIPPTETTKKLFYCLDNLMVLCPQKSGPWGVNHVHQAAMGTNLEQGVMKWAEGTPVICSKNQPELGLSNGDIGIITGENQNRRFLFRVVSDNQRFVCRLLHPSRLNNVEPAFALTIHKAQGSEANKVILLWPNMITNYSSIIRSSSTFESYDQKLIYTAITRAKESLEVNTVKG